MLIDFGPVRNSETKMLEFSQHFSLEDLREATKSYIDTIRDIMSNVNNAQLVYVPVDENASDSFATNADEANIPWTLAHVLVHMLASSEEGAAVSSVLARGVEFEGRLRYETPWQNVTIMSQVWQRIEESRHMRMAYLDTWPKHPNLDNMRKMSDGFIERFGQLNATASYLFSLMHEDDHINQLRQIKTQEGYHALAQVLD